MQNFPLSRAMYMRMVVRAIVTSNLRKPKALLVVVWTKTQDAWDESPNQDSRTQLPLLFCAVALTKVDFE